jgi:hypothetical protein
MDDERSRCAVDAAIRFGRGHASREELGAAARAAYAAAEAAKVAAYAAYAAYAAADADASLRTSAEIFKEHIKPEDFKL